MPNYVDELIATELPKAVESIGVEIREIAIKAAAQNALGNSRIFIQFQTAIIEGIGAYGSLLRRRIAQFDAEHSPVSFGDFNKAIASVDELRDRAAELYEKKRENQKPFGGNGLPFDEARLTAVVAGVKNELCGLRHEHASRRSMVGRWFKRGVDAFMQNLIFMFLMLISVFLLGTFFHMPVGTILDVLNKLKGG